MNWKPSEVYVTKGDCIRMYFKEDFFNYIRRVMAWEQDYHDAYQATVDYEISCIGIGIYTGELWSYFLNTMGIDIAREPEYRKEWEYLHMDLIVHGTKDDNSFILELVGNRMGRNAHHYLYGYKLTIEDYIEKFCLLGHSGMSNRKSKEQHNIDIDRQIKELQSQKI